MKNQAALIDRKRLPATLLAGAATQHAAVRPVADHTQPAGTRDGTHTPDLGHDFSQVPARTESAACTVTPTRCPFGGACHACPLPVQAKLAVNRPGDRYEQEADRVAEEVVYTEGVQLQRRAIGPVEPTHAPPIVHEVLRSPGQPLDSDTRAFMESRFGHDFSQVGVHADAKATESAQAVNASAYTVGRDVVFGQGQYAPHTNTGCRLLAHELTHVLQQSTGSVHRGLVLGQPQDIYEREADRASIQAIEPSRSAATTMQGGFTAAPAGRVQGQFITPPGAGGGYRGLMDRDRRRAFGERESETADQQGRASGENGCNVRLCFLPLEVLIEQGVPPEMAYVAAVHAYIQWDGRSAGFTRLAGERIGDARVISPEPRQGEPHERCVQARLRTIPSPTPGQMISFSPIGAARDIIAYGAGVYTSLRECGNPTCQSAKQRIQHMLVDDRRGLYSLFDENCETWARNVLSAACMQAPLTPGGGYGNLIQQLLRETPGGDLYHLARLLVGRTRPMPRP